MFAFYFYFFSFCWLFNFISYVHVYILSDGWRNTVLLLLPKLWLLHHASTSWSNSWQVICYKSCVIRNYTGGVRKDSYLFLFLCIKTCAICQMYWSLDCVSSAQACNFQSVLLSILHKISNKDMFHFKIKMCNYLVRNRPFEEWTLLNNKTTSFWFGKPAPLDF